MAVHFQIPLYITSWKTWNLPYQSLQVLRGSGTEMSFVILGDKAYLLKTYLMKPFARKDMSCEERVLNCKLSRARRCVECAFGILTAKWLLLNKGT